MTFSSLVQDVTGVLTMFREILYAFPAPVLLVAATGFSMVVLGAILKWMTG